MPAQFGTYRYGLGVYMFTQFDTWYGLGVLCLHSLVLGMA